MFSDRVDWELEENDLARALARKRTASELVLDLTASNPTRCELSYPGEEVLTALRPEGAALVYAPEPKGLSKAREAIARDYAGRGISLDPEALLLTSGTSEAYGFLFKLLCSPGDEILVPRPGYPLFDFLASLEAVRPRAYPLFFDGSWHVDFGALEAALTSRSRAVLAVHPGNPTGSYLSLSDRERLLELSAERGIALIVDEVFQDFPLREGVAAASFADATTGLVFVLNGLSKLAGLPQVKLAWIAARGAPELRARAVRGLEHVADQYLSVGTPVQLAAPRLLELAPSRRKAIADRLRENLELFSRLAHAEPSVSLLPPEGGWYATLRLPALQSSDAWALDLLESASVYAHPGSFFGYPGEAFLVVSLLTEPYVLERGLRKALRIVSARMGVSHE